MNALNQMIAQGGRPIQIESPLNQMAQFEQIRGGQQANMLRQQQMADIQREREQLQTLNRLYGEAYEPATGRVDESRLYGRLAESGFGSQIPGLQEQSSKASKATAESKTAQLKFARDELGAILNAVSSAVDQPSYNIARSNLQRLGIDVSGIPEVYSPKYVAQASREAMDAKQRVEADLSQTDSQFKTQKSKREFIAQAQRDISQNPSDANITAYTEDLLANPLFTKDEKKQMVANSERILAMPVDQRRAFLASQGASVSDLKPTTTVIDQGGQRQLVRTAPFSNQVTPLATYADVPLPADVQAQRMQVAEKGGAKIILPAQQKAFEAELGKGQADKVLADKVKAEDARDMLSTVSIGRDILKSGAITGAGADFFVGLNQALKTAGIDAGYADASANSQAYTANMAQNVGKLIKLFGAGTGLSDADRAYAEKMAGGKIALDMKALQKILDITERASRNVIKRHNKNVQGVKTNIPLEVELDEDVSTPAAAPMTAINPTTGERIQSTDGGKTWSKLRGK